MKTRFLIVATVICLFAAYGFAQKKPSAKPTVKLNPDTAKMSVAATPAKMN